MSPRSFHTNNLSTPPHSSTHFSSIHPPLHPPPIHFPSSTFHLSPSNPNILPSSQPVAGHLAVKPEYLSSQPSAAAKTSEPNRNKHYDPRKPHIANTKMTRQNWHKHVNWLNVTLIVIVPIIGLISAWWTPLKWQTALFSVVYYYFSGLGITAGYHRLWAHSSYSATQPLRIFLAAVGGGAVEGSVRWWARDHRAHHRYTEYVLYYLLLYEGSR